MTLTKGGIAVFIIGVAIAVIVVLKLIQVAGSSGVTVDSVAARTQGPEQAKVKIVEFIDFECPACAFGAQKLKEYVTHNPDDLRLEIKYYPLLNAHHHALQVASYVECISRQGRFWPFFDALMPVQSQWSQLVNAEGIFGQLALGAGADMKKLKSCLSSDNVSTTIMNEKSVGRSLGVQSTPTYFVNKKMVVGTKSLIEELNNYFPKSK